MLASNFGCILLQLLLLLPGVLQSLHPEPLQFNYLNILENLLKEKPAKTLLLLKRRHNFNCSLEELDSVIIPTLRLDELTEIQLIGFTNSEAISVVCMSEKEDLHLLTSLAKNLHRMRQMRIIIVLHISNFQPKEFLDDIQYQASKFNFVSLLVLCSNLLNIKKSIVAYRLQPFPTPTLERVIDLNNGTIFPKVSRNFQNKTALALMNPFSPTSFAIRDKKSGNNVLSGFMDKMLIEFAKKHNINLQISIPNVTLTDPEIMDLIINGSYDLTTHLRIFSMNIESSPIIGVTNAFIVVPCGQHIDISDVYKSLRLFVIIMCCIYTVFAIVETILEVANCRVFGQRHKFRFSTIILNLNAVRGILGQSINLFGNRRSISMHQFIIVMSIFSIIITCLFNANLSTLLTMPSEQNHISNYEELRESGLPVIFDNVYRKPIEYDMKSGISDISMEQAVFVPNTDRIRMILSRNSSNAYQMDDKTWTLLNKYQTNDKHKILCDPSALTFYKGFSVHGIVRHNSIYAAAFQDFILLLQGLGLKKHWTAEGYEHMLAYQNRTPNIPYPNPLTYWDLQWVWELLGICYAVSILVFIGELCLGYWQRRRVERLIIIV
ncbi:hypothetical protein KR044_003615 [Drosophila immigrans]|nr:hypothetical protein KR044_003615 [Drosophila immigrans]